MTKTLKIYRKKSKWNILLFLFAILIGVGSLIYTQFLVRNLKVEERKKVEMWAAAIRLINSADSTQNLEFPFSIIENNKTVPVILTDGHDNIIAASNFEATIADDPKSLGLQLEKIKTEKDPIIIDLGGGFINRVYYKDSIILTQLIYYPYVQLGLDNNVHCCFIYCPQHIKKSRAEPRMGRHVKGNGTSAWDTNHFPFGLG